MCADTFDFVVRHSSEVKLIELPTCQQLIVQHEMLQVGTRAAGRLRDLWWNSLGYIEIDRVFEEPLDPLIWCSQSLCKLLPNKQVKFLLSTLPDHSSPRLLAVFVAIHY